MGTSTELAFQNKTRNPLIIFMEENPGMLWETGKLGKAAPSSNSRRERFKQLPSETYAKDVQGVGNARET